MAFDAGRAFTVGGDGFMVESDAGDELIWIGGGTDAPADDAPIGSRYFRTNGEEYVKTVVGAGASNWELIESLANYVFVSKQGNDTTGTGDMTRPFLTLNAAVAHIVANETPTATNEFVILVAPGSYSETPLTLPNFVTIEGSGSSSTHFVCNVADTNFLTVSTGCNLRNFRVQNVTGASNPAAILLTNPSVQVDQDIYNISFITVDVGVSLQSVPSAARVFIHDLRGILVNNYLIDFTDDVFAQVSNLYGVIVATLVRVGAGCDVNIDSIRTEICTAGIEVVSNGKVGLSNADLRGTTTPILCSSSTAEINVFDGIYNESSIQITDLAVYRGSVHNTDPNQRSLSLTQELNVGQPERGVESVFGEGDSFVRGRRMYTFDGVSYTDVSTRAQFIGDANTISFPNTNVDSAIYISTNLVDESTADFKKHFGLKLNLTTAANLGAGELVLEYWDGATWVEFNHMLTQAERPYLPFGNEFFTQTGQFQNRYDLAIGDTWVKNDDPSFGTDLFWVRMRIATAITTSPVFDQLKLHTSRAEINKDGFIEFFGAGRIVKKFPVTFGAFQAANNSPANQDVYLADQLGIGRIENEFQDGVTDRTGFVQFLPRDIATAAGLKLTLAYFTENNSGGNITWVVRWALSSQGDGIFSTTGQAPGTAPGQRSITTVASAPTAQQTLDVIEFSLEIPEAIAERAIGNSDLLWVTVQRSGSAGTDTHTGNVVVAELAAYYTAWRVGGHTDDF